ncbi:cytochrome P450 [Tistlia consotensis]|uniref:cytochrome P450 n=1 Tax=Tistlia consotensis TaxID=1321365 RepID=UPI00190E6AF3|nr:cytochrome P450 [Tistlia consotensis]
MAAGRAGEAGGRDEALVRGFDLRKVGPDFLENPYPTYHALRRLSPVHRCPDGSLFLTRWDDLNRVYRDHEGFSSDKTVEFRPKYGDSPLYRHHTTSLVFNDPPKHSRVRRLLAPAFTPRALRLLEARFVALVDGLLDKAEARGGMDVVTDYAASLPVQIIGDMLGVPEAERGPLRDWSLAILGALEPLPSQAALDWGNRSVTEFSDYLAGHVARYRRGGLAEGGEVLGLLVDGEVEGERLSDEELVQNCIFLLNAGHETTTNLIGNGVAALLGHPGELARLRAEPSLIESAVEEFLRFESSNQLGNRRAVTDAEVGGVAVPAGTLVTLCIGAANRDPAQFAEPDRLDVARRPNRHLAFGGGIHACAGMTLARLEGRIAIGRLLARVPSFRPAGPFTRGGRARFRGFLSYPVTFGET